MSPGSRFGRLGARSSGNLDPDLRESPSLVQLELAAAHIGGEVDFEDDIGDLIGCHLDGVAERASHDGPRVDDLVRLHDPMAIAVAVAQQEIGSAEDFDVDAGRGGDTVCHPRQPDG